MNTVGLMNSSLKLPINKLFVTLLQSCNFSKKSLAAKRSQALLATATKKASPNEIPGKSSIPRLSKNISLKVIGSGAEGTPGSLAVFLDVYGNNILFNCGEGTYRVSHEIPGSREFHHIFITHNSWKNVSGIPGLRPSFIRGPRNEGHLSTYGPNGFASLWKSLSTMDNLWIPLTHHNPSTQPINIDALSIRTVTLEKSKDEESKSKSDSVCPSDSNELAYAYVCHIPKMPLKTSISLMMKYGVTPGEMVNDLKSGKSVTVEDGRVVHPEDVCTIHHGGNFVVLEAPSIDYLDSLTSSDAFDKFKAKSISQNKHTENLSPHLIQQTKEISNITEENTTKKEVFFWEEFTDALCTASCTCSEDLSVIVHFTPPNVMRHPRYVNWVNSFPSSTKHIAINNESAGLYIEKAIAQQIVMNHLLPTIYPMFLNESLKNLSSKHRNKMRKLEKDIESGRKTFDDYFEVAKRLDTTTENLCNNENKDSIRDTDTIGFEGSNNDTFIEDRFVKKVSLDPNISENKISVGETISDTPLLVKENKYGFLGKTIQANSYISYQIRPVYEKIDMNRRPPDLEHLVVRSLYLKEGFEEALNEMKANLKEIDQTFVPDDRFKVFPKVTFLGTGSASASMKRNVAGILLQMKEDSNMILDCGDSTYVQLVALEGIERAREILLNLKAIYVSHHHCDHHIGLITLILEKINAHRIANKSMDKLFILGPPLVFQHLKNFHVNFKSILHRLICINNMTLIKDKDCFTNKNYLELIRSLNLKNFDSTFVKHCKDAFGVALTHENGWKLCYSGDCRPSEKLVDIGQDCDLLIHEATFADNLQVDAVTKKHSTVSEAIDVSHQMNAKNVILTHFSQRYCEIPYIKYNLPHNVGLAFDFMKVTVNDLPYLPHLYPVLKVIHEADYENHSTLDERQKAFYRPEKKFKWTRAAKEFEIS